MVDAIFDRCWPMRLRGVVTGDGALGRCGSRGRSCAAIDIWR
jgi:hypothetical protein